MRDALSAFLYVAAAYMLLALFPVLTATGFVLFGVGGAFAGFMAAMFIVSWAACWYVDS